MSSKRTFWWIGLFAAILAIILLPGCGGGTEATSSVGDEQAADQAATDQVATTGDEDPYATGIHHVVIDVEGYGQIEVEVNANAAPITVSNFCHLVEDGFYDGLTFHRIIAGFMIQGGDPLGNGTGGSSTTITGEFSSNGIMNPIQHKRGVISMARSQDPDSASSQFFIMHQDAESLDGNYAAFGRVTSGMEVVDAIAENTPVEDENGTVAPENQPRITSITLVD